MKIAIIGPGAIGRLLAWTLSQGGHTPLLVCRRAAQADAFAREGLTCMDVDGTEQHISVEAIVGNALEAWPADIDGAIVTVKSYDTLTAGKQIAGGTDLSARKQIAARSEMPILSLQNGLGNGETLAKVLDRRRLAIGLTTHGAIAEGETKVLYKGSGNTVFGDFSVRGIAEDRSPALWWSDLFNACEHPVRVTDDIRTEVWSKAMVNIGINPFTALLGIRNGEILDHPELLTYVEQTVREAEQAARAEGIPLTDSFTRVLDVCQHTAANHSSMLQDLQRGRKTEIDSLCGIIVERGRKHNISTSYNAALYELVKRAEEEYAPLTMTQVIENISLTK